MSRESIKPYNSKLREGERVPGIGRAALLHPGSLKNVIPAKLRVLAGRGREDVTCVSLGVFRRITLRRDTSVNVTSLFVLLANGGKLSERNTE